MSETRTGAAAFRFRQARRAERHGAPDPFAPDLGGDTPPPPSAPLSRWWLGAGVVVVVGGLYLWGNR